MPREGEAIGRQLVVAWFKPVFVDGNDITVHPESLGSSGDLKVLNSTVAEIALAAGHYPTLADNATARDHEAMHENRFGLRD